jgi:hypothetical protein
VISCFQRDWILGPYGRRKVAGCCPGPVDQEGLNFGDPHHHAWERRRAQAERFTGPGSAVQDPSLRGKWSSRRSLHNNGRSGWNQLR